MNARARPLIVGAGPAGIRAAQTLVAADLRPIVVDEGAVCGGQIYRQPPVFDGRDRRALYGSEAAKAERLHQGFADLAGRIDYLPNALVWNLRDGTADVLVEDANRRITYDGVILATGATDRVLPVPGWTLPGVFTLGGAQIALKAQGCTIGSRVVFVGTGPLLYLVAWQYMKAGVEIGAILDAAPAAAHLALLKGLASFPAIVLRGIRYVADLRMRRVPLYHGVTRLRFEGASRLSTVSFEAAGRSRSLGCDGAGYGLGLRSETQLADISGCRFEFSLRDRAWLPARDPAGRSTVQGIYLAGDGAGIAGADAAERAGERAALALCQDRSLPVDARRAAQLERELARIGHFRSLLEDAFPFPAHWNSELQEEMHLCRCEEVRVSTIHAAIQQFDITEINRLKAVSRVGMGRCQGRICGTAAAELLAARAGLPIDRVGRLRAQPPVKPLPLGLNDEHTEAAA